MLSPVHTPRSGSTPRLWLLEQRGKIHEVMKVDIPRHRARSIWLAILGATGLILAAPAQARQAEPPAPATAVAPVPNPPRVDAVFAEDGVTITDGGHPVLFYRTKASDPAEPGRLNYIHPLYAPDGTLLTEDRPADHLAPPRVRRRRL